MFTNHHYYRHNQRWQLHSKQGEFNIFLVHTRALLLSLLLFLFIGTNEIANKNKQISFGSLRRL